MKKHALASAIVTAGILLITPAAFAQSVNVTTDGPNSPVDVNVEDSTHNNCDVTNNVEGNVQNDQNSTSGNASAGNNSSAGNVGSGDSNTTNETNVDVNIDNGCGNNTTEEETPTPQTPEAQKPVVPASTTTTPKVLSATVTALPNTGSALLGKAAIATMLAAAAAAVATFGARVASRRN